MRDSAFLRDNPEQAKTAYRKKACLHAICYKEIAPPLRALKKHHPHVLDAPLIAGIDGTVDSAFVSQEEAGLYRQRHSTLRMKKKFSAFELS